MSAWFRKSVGLLAVALLLMHAMLVVRHSAVMLAIKLEHQQLLISLGVICHGNGGTVSVPQGDLPYVPERSPDPGQCPLCAGAAPAFAVLDTPAVIPERVSLSASERIRVVRDELTARAIALPPPARGPPLHA